MTLEITLILVPHVPEKYSLIGQYGKNGASFESQVQSSVLCYRLVLEVLKGTFIVCFHNVLTVPGFFAVVIVFFSFFLKNCCLF